MCKKEQTGKLQQEITEYLVEVDSELKDQNEQYDPDYVQSKVITKLLLDGYSVSLYKNQILLRKEQEEIALVGLHVNPYDIEVEIIAK